MPPSGDAGQAAQTQAHGKGCSNGHPGGQVGCSVHSGGVGRHTPSAAQVSCGTQSRSEEQVEPA